MAGGVVVTLTAVAPVSQPCAPPAAYSAVCGGPCGHSDWCCGAVLGLRSREGCTNGAEISVAVYPDASGPCCLLVVPLVRAREGEEEGPDAAASAVSTCTLSAAGRAYSVGGKMVWICVRSVRGLLVGRWAPAVGDICRRCVPPGSSWPCRRQRGRSPAALLRAACVVSVGCPPTSWTPEAVSVSEGNVVRFLPPGRVDHRGPARGG